MNTSTDFIYSLSKFDNIENFKKLVNIRVEKGYMVRGESVLEWNFQGFRLENNEQVLYTSMENTDGMKSLSDVLGLEKNEALDKLILLAEAIAVLSKTPSRQYEIGLDMIFFTPDNGVVFLPAALFRKMREMAKEDYGKTHLLINNPYFLKQDERAIWALEALCYRVLTGAFPFEAPTASQLKDRIRQKGSAPAHRYAPDLKPEIARHFQDFFNSPDVCMVALVHVVKNLRTWRRDGVATVLDEHQRREIIQHSEQEQATDDKRLARRLYWEKYWKTWAIGIGLGVAAIVLVGVYLSTTAFRPRVTKGYVPEKVVDVYFQSMNTLNVSDMGDCVIDEAQKGWAESLSILAPMSRQYEAMYGKSLVVNAADWVKSGKPPIAPPRYPFGAANLVLVKESGEPQPAYRAEYEMYYRDVDPDNRESKDQYDLVYRVKERYSLRQDSGDWVIFRIESLEKTLIEKTKSVLPPG